MEPALAGGLRGRDESEEVGHHLVAVADDMGAVAELVQEHGVMQGPVVAVTPEIRELHHDLVVVPLRAPADRDGRSRHGRALYSRLLSSNSCNAFWTS